MHLIVVWQLVSSHQPSVKAKSGSLQLVWIAQKTSPEAVPESSKHPEKARNTVLRHRSDDTTASPSTNIPSNKEDNSTHLAPDWSEELHIAAKNAVTAELAKKRHELDFSHVYPQTPTKLPQIAWDHAATHRIELIPQGGMLIHISDKCVLILFPLPFVGCGIGKQPANGDLFEHLREK